MITQQQQETINKIFENAFRDASLVDVDVLCEPLACSHKTILNYIYAGKLKAVKIGSKWKVTTQEVERFVNDHIAATPVFVPEDKPKRRRGRPPKVAKDPQNLGPFNR